MSSVSNDFRELQHVDSSEQWKDMMMLRSGYGCQPARKSFGELSLTEGTQSRAMSLFFGNADVLLHASTYVVDLISAPDTVSILAAILGRDMQHMHFPAKQTSIPTILHQIWRRLYPGCISCSSHDCFWVDRIGERHRQDGSQWQLSSTLARACTFTRYIKGSIGEIYIFDP